MQQFSKNTIKSAKKIFQILEIISLVSPVRISELVEISGLTQSTVQRIVNTLVVEGYVKQSKLSQEYFLSSKLLLLSQRVLEQTNSEILDLITPVMKKLHNITDETINFSLLNWGELIYLKELMSRKSLIASFDIGMVFPFHATSMGKAVLANNNDINRAELQLLPYTKNTTTSLDELEVELEKIRDAGYALDAQEFSEDLYCVSVPIFDSAEKAIGAIGITFPSARFVEEKVPAYGNLLLEAVKELQVNIN